MATSAVNLYFFENVHLSWIVLAALLICVLLNFIFSTVRDERPYKGIPVISMPNLDPKTSWLKQGRAVVSKGSKMGSPFQVITGTGPKIVLPNRFADDIKMHPELSLEDAFDKEFFFHYPGFEGFAHNKKEKGFLPDLVRTKLTASLGLIMEDLVDETTASIHDIFGEDDQWHGVVLKPCVTDVVARLSSRVFLGLPLCRNKRWLEISQEYTLHAIGGARALRATPSLLRPILQFFLPQMRQLRKHVRDAKNLIQPEVETRRARAIQTLEKGQKPPKTADTIGWMVEMTQGRREELDYVAAQLSLSMAAIHTTSEAITVALLDVCLHPNVAKVLREEIVEVVGAEGWSKKALVNMKRLDSFLKESQRFHLTNVVSLNRLVKNAITLSDGSTLPANSCIMVTAANMDPSVYSNADTFEPWRFVAEGHWEHVSIQHPSQLSFGYGKHACPGRFFASNEIKIALSHLLLKYDWKLVSNENPFWENETQSMIKPEFSVQLRRRVAEIELDLNEQVE